MICTKRGQLVKPEHQTNSGLPVLASSCPEAYKELGSCSNFDNPKECLAEIAVEHFSASLPTPDDCAIIQISVGTFTTTACGKEC